MFTGYVQRGQAFRDAVNALSPFLTIHQKTTIMKTTKTPDHNPTGRTRPKRKMGTVLRAKLSKYRARVSDLKMTRPAALSCAGSSSFSFFTFSSSAAFTSAAPGSETRRKP